MAFYPERQTTLLRTVTNSRGRERKRGVRFRQRRAVKDRHDAIFPAALAKSQASGRGMSHDVATNRLGRVFGKTHPVGVCNDLIGDENRNAKFLGHSSQLSEKLADLHLTLRKFSATHVIGTEESGSGIDNQQGVSILSHNGGRRFEEFHLVLRVVGSSNCNIFQRRSWIQVETFGNGLETLWTEGPFRINVDGLSFGAPFVDGLLAGDTQGVTELRLPGTKFAKHFRNGSSFDTALQELVEFRRPSSQANDVLSVFQSVRCCLEVHCDHGLDRLLQFCNFGFGDPLDVRQLSVGGMGNLYKEGKVEWSRKKSGKKEKWRSDTIIRRRRRHDNNGVRVITTCRMTDSTHRFDRIVPGGAKFFNVIGGDSMLLQNIEGLKALVHLGGKPPKVCVSVRVSLMTLVLIWKPNDESKKVRVVETRRQRMERSLICYNIE